MSDPLTNLITVAYDKGDGDIPALCFRKGRIIQATLFGDTAHFVYAAMQQKAKLYDALHDLHSLYAGTDRTLDESEVLGEVQELLYGDYSCE